MYKIEVKHRSSLQSLDPKVWESFRGSLTTSEGTTYEQLRDPDLGAGVLMQLDGLARFVHLSQTALKKTLLSLAEKELVTMDDDFFSQDGGRLVVEDLPEADVQAKTSSNEQFTVESFLKFYSDRHYKSTGARLVVVRGKDHKLVKQLIDAFPKELLTQMVKNFFMFSQVTYSLGYFWGQREVLLSDANEDLRQNRR